MVPAALMDPAMRSEQKTVQDRKLKTLQSLSEQSLSKKPVSPDAQRSQVNDYVLRSVSIIMELPIKQIRYESHTAVSCNARMICYFVLNSQMGYSYRQIAAMYNANVSMVHRTVARMKLYYSRNFYPELNKVADLVSQALQEKTA